MRDINVEKKLQLVHQVRSQHNRNQYDMRTREQILYGKSSADNFTGKKVKPDFSLNDPINYADYDTPYAEPASFFSSLKLRIIIAFVLFAGLLILDMSGSTLFGLDTAVIFESVAADYGLDDIDFMDNLSAFSLNE